MKKHLPKEPWTEDLLAKLPWRHLSEISRYHNKSRAKRRIHKLERAAAKREIRIEQQPVTGQHEAR